MRTTQYAAGGRAPTRSPHGRTARGHLLVLIGLALLVAGCAGPAAFPAPRAAQAALPEAGLPATLTPRPGTESDSTACPAERVSVGSVSWYRDSHDAWRVVGLIGNRWDRPVAKIVTAVEALDAAGQVIDHGEDISAYPLNLQPGAQAPFSAWIKRDFPGAARFQVTVEECVAAENVPRAQIEVQGSRLLIDAAGRGQVTGELYNSGTQPVLVNGLMAALLDDAGAPLAADNAVVASRYLGPGERGPLRATLELPPAASGRVTRFRLYMDPVMTGPQTLPGLSESDLRVSSRYVDAAGKFHLVAQVTNPGPTSLSLRLQATLYEAAAGTAVVDAAYLDSAQPLAAGETRQLDLTDWGPVNGEPGLAEAMVRGDAAVSLRLDPFASWTGVAGAAKNSK